MPDPTFDKARLLGLLDRIDPEKTSGKDEAAFRSMSLGRSLRTLAELDHEHAWQLCREVAARVLGSLPEPPDFPPEEE